MLAELPKDCHPLVHQRVEYMWKQVEDRLLTEVQSCYGDDDAMRRSLDVIYAFDFAVGRADIPSATSTPPSDVDPLPPLPLTLGV